jgi:hypothetical protein
MVGGKSNPVTIHIHGILLLTLVISGCGAVATQTKFYAPVTEELESGRYELAAQKFEAARKKFGHKDRFLYFIDSGALYHYAGSHDSSIARLSLAETAAEELFTRSISRAAGSLLLNDNLLEYSGEDHEILYANLLKALAFAAKGDYEGAFVEIRRANLKLNLLEQKYLDATEIFNRNKSKDDAEINYEARKVRFNNDAFARYLSMHMYAALGKMDDARIDFELLGEAFVTQPHIYDFARPEVKYSSDSAAILSVVGLVGLSPVKEALNLRIRTDKDLNLVQVLYTDSENKDAEYGHLPWPVSEDYYFKFAIPKLVKRPTDIASIRVFADSICLGQLDLLEDIGRVAEETFEAKKSLIYLRSLARAVVKGLAGHKLKKKVDSDGFEGWLKKAAIDVGADITENADLRCARFLPGQIFVADIEIPPGIYDFKLEFLDFNGHKIGEEIRNDMAVSGRGFNLLQVSCTAY